MTKEMQSLEQLSNEYHLILNSKEYRLGSKLLNIKNKIKKGHFLSVLKDINIHYQMRKYSKECHSIFNINNIPIKNKKIIIYTCIIGNYDKLNEPTYINENCEYVLITDNHKIKSEYWKIYRVPNEIIKRFQSNTTLINRFYKLNPHIVFPNYDYSIYIDGCVKIISDISTLINSISNKTGIACHIHSSRDCIYDEYKVCKILKKGNTSALKKQLKRYQKLGFPKKYGMLECGILATDIKNDMAINILNLWWNEFKQSESLRDQISLPFILWNLNLDTKSIGTIGNNIYDNPKCIVYRNH